MHHRVDVQVGEESTERTAVDADPFDPVQEVGELDAGVRCVHPDDPFDARVGGQSGRHVGAQVTAHSGDDDDPRSTWGATGGHLTHLPRQDGPSRDDHGLIT